MRTLIGFAWLYFALAVLNSVAATTLRTSPAEIAGPKTTINFDNAANGTAANTLYSGLGIQFQRDDNQVVNIFDWNALERSTVSQPNVIATISGLGADSYVSHLNVISAGPIFAAGAFFGNDQWDVDFSRIELSAYGIANQLLGSVSVDVNSNTSVDQFIGIQSDTPIYRLRFENLQPTGSPSLDYSVVLDDFTFTAVPEPSTLGLAGLGAAGLMIFRRRK